MKHVNPPRLARALVAATILAMAAFGGGSPLPVNAAAHAPVAPLNWGKNSENQLGNPNPMFSTAAASPAGLSGTFTAVASGGDHSVAVRNDGTVWSWGDDSKGELGNNTCCGPSVTPVEALGLPAVTQVAAYQWDTLARASNGTVWGWGANGQGQLGSNCCTPSYVPVQVPGLSSMTAVSEGDTFSVALKSDGTVWTWGDNTHGELGSGSFAPTGRTAPGQVAGLTSVIAIAAGQFFALALRSDGTVWAWGENAQGELGNGTCCADSATATAVTGSLSSVTALAAGADNGVAVTSSGAVWTWGDNTQGQLGNGTCCTAVWTPTQVAGITTAVAAAAGNQFVELLYSDGTVWGFGQNGFGNLAHLGTGNHWSAVQAIGVTDVTAISSSGSTTVALGVAHTVQVNPGTLTLTAPATISFGPLTLTGPDLQTSATTGFTVDDATGSGAGWNLTATSTTFTDAGGQTLPATAAAVGATPAVGCDVGSTCVVPTLSGAYPYTLPAGSAAPAATKLVSAGAGSGMGAAVVSPTFTLSVPANTYAGTYTSTWTISLVSGP